MTAPYKGKLENIIVKLTQAREDRHVVGLKIDCRLYFKIPCPDGLRDRPLQNAVQTPLGLLSLSEHRNPNDFTWNGKVLLMSGEECAIDQSTFSTNPDDNTVARLQGRVAEVLGKNKNQITLVGKSASPLPLSMILPAPSLEANPINVVTMAQHRPEESGISEADIVEGIGKAFVCSFYDSYSFARCDRRFSFYDYDPKKPNELKLLDPKDNVIWTWCLTFCEQDASDPQETLKKNEFHYIFNVVQMQDKIIINEPTVILMMQDQSGGAMQDVEAARNQAPEEKARGVLKVPRGRTEFAFAKVVAVWVWAESFCHWSHSIASHKKVFVRYGSSTAATYALNLKSTRGRNEYRVTFQSLMEYKLPSPETASAGCTSIPSCALM